MRHASVNGTIGILRTPESILIDRERAAFRQAVLDEVFAALASDLYLGLVIHARYTLGWTLEMIATEFRIDPQTALRAHNRALEIMRRKLAAKGVKHLTDIL